MDSEEAAALFRATVGNVTPLTEPNRISPPAPSTQARVRTPVSRHTIPDTLSDFPSGNLPETYLSNGVSRLTLRKLKHSPVQDTLDLHGNSTDAARVLLQQFLFEATRQQMRCVLVIHGKGTNSQNGEAVLRIHTRHWLTQHAQVLAFCPAEPASGGNGAVLVLLKI